ncbi:Protein of unknown function [Sphingobium sp. AP50]|uniref:DUF2726 domain-containing protein n=1 Tax=Sphingobium sp. AP50 TaxID=1884369 RepID=UPI0008BF5135|nr:DUF2726 domain-containing protein [Sphingobium sp. AP50]SEK02252.1 Protein of unknown function [Sphingobium sp. AP50]
MVNYLNVLSIIVFGISTIVLLKVGSVLLGLGGRNAADTPIAKSFMTAREEAMLETLEHLLPAHRIHAQVAMGALLKPSARVDRRRRHAARNVFSQKIVDFVVQDRTTGRVIALIEVDDRSHKAVRDDRRDAMTARAGYHTVRIPASASASLADVMPFLVSLRE